MVVMDIVSLKDGDGEFLKIAGEHVAKSRDADGVLQVAVLSSMCKPHSYKVVERYKSEAAWKNQSKATLSAARLYIFVTTSRATNAMRAMAMRLKPILCPSFRTLKHDFLCIHKVGR